MLSTSEHKVSQPSFSQNRSSNSTGLDMDKTEVGLSYSAPNTAAYQTSYQSQKASGTGYQQASSYTSSNYSSTQVSLNRTQQNALVLILIFTVPCQGEIRSQRKLHEFVSASSLDPPYVMGLCVLNFCMEQFCSSTREITWHN